MSGKSKVTRKRGRPVGSKKEINNNSVSLTLARENQRQGRDGMKVNKPVKVHVNQEVLARWNDGLFYLGSIVKIDEKNSRCSVSFEDNSEYWILYKDIQVGAIQGEIICCICQEELSEKPNEIVLCDNCGLGYHQQCHNPPILGDILCPDVEFLCRLCVFATNVKKGGALKMGPNAKTFQDMKQSLPYNLHRLTWDAQHKTNVEQYYCYCGGPGDWYSKMLQCCRCRQWFHEACIQCLEHPLLYGDRFYVFVCAHCNNGPEYIKRLDMKWVDLVQLVLFNLTLQGVKKYYDVDDVVAPFILDKWKHIQISNFDSRPSLSEVKQKINEVFDHHKTRFCCGREIRKKSSLWGLRVRLPPPAPTVILPMEGPINDEVMANLQVKGRKTRTFVPIQCNSPIPLRYRKNGLDIDDSIVFKSEKARKLLQDATTKNALLDCSSMNQSYTGYNGLQTNTDYISRFKPDQIKPPRNTAFSLDDFIPRLDHYDGANHPFKTHLEQNEEIKQKQFFQQKILDLCESLSSSETASTVDTASLSDVDSASCKSFDVFASYPGDSALGVGHKRKRTPCQPYNAGLDINSNVRGPRKRKGRELCVEKGKSLCMDKGRELCVDKGRSPCVDNVVSSELIAEVKNTEIDVNKLKYKVGKYLKDDFSLDNTEGFNVIARRTSGAGNYEYLVEWNKR